MAIPQVAIGVGPGVGTPSNCPAPVPAATLVSDAAAATRTAGCGAASNSVNTNDAPEGWRPGSNGAGELAVDGGHCSGIRIPGTVTAGEAGVGRKVKKNGPKRVSVAVVTGEEWCAGDGGMLAAGGRWRVKGGGMDMDGGER